MEIGSGLEFWDLSSESLEIDSGLEFRNLPSESLEIGSGLEFWNLRVFLEVDSGYGVLESPV